MPNTKRFFHILLSGIFAGALIALAATVNLCIIAESGSNPGLFKVIGAFTFPIGLYLIINFGLWLFTGKVGFALDNKPSYILELLLCLLGNMIGVCAICGLGSSTRVFGSKLNSEAVTLCNPKINDSWYSMLFLAILCGMIIYLAVIAHKKIDNPVGKVTSVFLLIALFILCGFEHSIADAAYFFYAQLFTWKGFLWIMLIVVGNSIGSLLIDLLFKGINKCTENKE